ncbi:hypothetical protein AC578_1585 [Pseudocercospora eumusae]|uniref:Uncharacterized protein n=1 Tax=Pseudocercospora eumusae TaxID=321146 RepID=A0A139HLX0_9PEZI|nr:hypothetical protein AC578_1585 [Pseudocercospora eumusae]
MLLAAPKFSTLGFLQAGNDQAIDTEGSSAVILNHTKSLSGSATKATDERSRAQQGALVITIANNLLLEDKPAGAIVELVARKPLNEHNVSPYE